MTAKWVWGPVSGLPSAHPADTAWPHVRCKQCLSCGVVLECGMRGKGGVGCGGWVVGWVLMKGSSRQLFCVMWCAAAMRLPCCADGAPLAARVVWWLQQGLAGDSARTAGSYQHTQLNTQWFTHTVMVACQCCAYAQAGCGWQGVAGCTGRLLLTASYSFHQPPTLYAGGGA